MAESRTPPLSRSSHKPLEYTSCINTSLSSSTPISTCGNINAHSSFDSISQPRDCDSLVNPDNHVPQHRALERDIRQLDIHSNKHNTETKQKKLARKESISLPTTPVEQISSKHNHKCHALLLEQAANNILAIDDDDDDNDDDKLSYHFTSPTDYMIATSEQIPGDDSMKNSKR